MKGEFPLFGEDDQNNRDTAFDNIERYLETEPALRVARGFLQRAKASDEALEFTAEARTRRFRIRSAGTDNFPFVHDRLMLIPKRNDEEFATVAYRYMRFAVTDGDTANQDPKAVFITDYDAEDEPFGEYVLTEQGFGLYSDDVRLQLKDGHLEEVVNLKHDADDPTFFAAQLEMFELDHQTNKPSEAA